MKRKIMCIIVALLIVLSNIPAYAGINKDETVYVMLNNDGSVSNIKVVNHVYGSDSSDSFTDYGRYTDIRNLTDNTAPQISEGKIVWPMSLLKDGDLYYEGTIQKELPVDIVIKYFLDGKETVPAELAGKDGSLKIDINVSFNETAKKYWLMAQIQVVASLDVFSDIKTSGSKVIVGSAANIAFIAIPPKEQSFTLEMDGKGISLDPITISLIPAKFSIPKDIGDSIDQLTDGLGEIENGASKLENGMSGVVSGTKKLKSGTEELNGGIGQIYSASSEIYSQSGNISSGMEEFQKGLSMLTGMDSEAPKGVDQLVSGMEQLSQKSGEINDGIKGLYNGSVQLGTGYKDLAGGIKKLQSGHEQLVQAAKLLQGSDDPIVQRLVQGIIEEAKAMEGISQGMAESNKGFDNLGQNIKSLSDNYGQFNEGLSTASENIKQFSGSASRLPETLQMMYKSFGELKYGTDQLFGGYGEVNKALGALKDNTETLPREIDKLISGQNDIKGGIHDLNNAGIKKMRYELKENIDNSILGKSENELYTSYVDNENNKNSTVQFVMRTSGIPKLEEKKVEQVKVEEKKNFLQRILDLFR